MDSDVIVYQFSRSPVEHGDFSHFLNLYGADKLPTGRRLRLFLRKDFGPMNVICERAGMFERLIYDRTKRVFEYFELPFDAKPPS